MTEYGTLPTTNPHHTAESTASEIPSGRAHWRVQLGELLESLTMVDAAAVLLQILYTFFHECQVPDEKYNNDNYLITTFLSTTVLGHAISEGWLIAFEAAESISMFIACLFLLECILSFIAFGPRFYLPGTEHWKLHIFDVVVVVSTFVLEVILRGKEREAAGLLIIFRLWRIVKVMDAVIKGFAYSNEEEMDELREEIEKLKSAYATLEKQFVEANNKNEELKRQLESK
ncbi:hypothetical protein BJ944DRAFT_228335 [Cunninghamella echinulata]|nr:hypothetical protein BJ944DRAFT_228335 [Cunninghamella echinulata]